MEMENVINLPMYSQFVFLNLYLFVYLSLQFYIHKLILILFYLPIFYPLDYVKIIERIWKITVARVAARTSRNASEYPRKE